MARITVSFRAYTIANYAKNFDGFSGEKFEIDEPRSGGATAIVVPTRMVSTDGAVPVELDYVMKGGPDHWRITDVLADGSVSPMAAKRAELVPVLKKDGADGLIAALDARTKAMAK
jgi:phospholipid transport system substrate-binding protein